MDKLNKWQLHYLSQSLTRAKRLEKQREEVYEELYKTITYPAMRLDSTIEGLQSHATDAQAIRIIDLQRRYDKRIQREYDRHVRWRGILEWVDDHDREILIRYFQKKKYVQPKIISRVLFKIENRLIEEEQRIEQERDKKAISDFQKHQEKESSFGRKIVAIESLESVIPKSDEEKRNRRQEKMRRLFMQGR